MKLFAKTLLAAVIIVIVLFGIAYFFALFKGESLIISYLENATKREVSIGSFSLRFPLNLKIKNLVITDLFKANSIFVSSNIIGFLTGKIVLDEVELSRPEFIYERFPVSAISKPSASTPALRTTIKSEPRPKKSTPIRLLLRQLNIKDARIVFIDHTVEEEIKISINDINFNLNNLYLFPASAVASFKLTGNIPWEKDEEEGRIEADGWFNLYKKDMQAQLKIEDIDGIYLYPYYSNWVDLEKARIQKAKLNFTSDIQSKDNNLVAKNHLELTDIVRVPRIEEEAEEKEKAEKITDAVLEIFRGLDEGKTVLDFTIRTKMDEPRFGFADIKMAFEHKLAEGMKSDRVTVEDILSFPRKVIEGTVKGATDVSKAVVEGAVAVGKEIKKTIEESFKKEEKTPQSDLSQP